MPNLEPGTDTIIPHEDYIEVIWDGPQNTEKVRKSNHQTQLAADQFAAQDKPLLLLFLIQNHPAVPNMGAFQEVIKMFRIVEFKRLVICGKLPNTVMTLVTTVISSFEHELEVKYITDPVEALAWLRGPGA